MKKIAVAVLMALGMVGCANQDIYGGDVYSSEQAKEARSISYGTIVYYEIGRASCRERV